MTVANLLNNLAANNNDYSKYVSSNQSQSQSQALQYTSENLEINSELNAKIYKENGDVVEISKTFNLSYSKETALYVANQNVQNSINNIDDKTLKGNNQPIEYNPKNVIDSIKDKLMEVVDNLNQIKANKGTGIDLKQMLLDAVDNANKNTEKQLNLSNTKDMNSDLKDISKDIKKIAQQVKKIIESIF